MNQERVKSILEILIEKKKVTVKDLSLRLFASESSIRRDLCSLEQQGLIKRIDSQSQCLVSGCLNQRLFHDSFPYRKKGSAGNHKRLKGTDQIK